MRPKRVQRHPMIDADLSQQLRTYCATKRVTETAVFNGAFVTTSRTPRTRRSSCGVSTGTIAPSRSRASRRDLSETFVAFMLSHLPTRRSA